MRRKGNKTISGCRHNFSKCPARTNIGGRLGPKSVHGTSSLYISFAYMSHRQPSHAAMLPGLHAAPLITRSPLQLLFAPNHEVNYQGWNFFISSLQVVVFQKYLSGMIAPIYSRPFVLLVFGRVRQRTSMDRFPQNQPPLRYPLLAEAEFVGLKVSSP